MKIFLIVALIGSIILNVFLYLDATCKVDWLTGTCETTIKVDSIVYQQDTSFCVSDTGRYHYLKGSASGVMVAAADAKSHIDAAYDEGLPAQTLRGGFISKLGLDKIFSEDLTATGVNVYIGKNGAKYYLYTEAGHNINYKIRADNGFAPTGPPIIQNGLVCPMDCGDMYAQQ